MFLTSLKIVKQFSPNDIFQTIFADFLKFSIVGNFLTMTGENCPAKNVGENCLENIVRRKMSSKKCPAKNVSENFPENFIRRKNLAKLVRVPKIGG
jgi:hypothetical protein